MRERTGPGDAPPVGRPARVGGLVRPLLSLLAAAACTAAVVGLVKVAVGTASGQRLDQLILSGAGEHEGPLAQYAELEFARIGLDARSITGGGHTNAHAVFQIDASDAVLVLAPRVIFADVLRFIEAVARKGVRVFIITQATLPASLHDLDVVQLRTPPSGNSSATEAVTTIALIDALVAEIATLQPERALDARARAQTYRDEFSR